MASLVGRRRAGIGQTLAAAALVAFVGAGCGGSGSAEAESKGPVADLAAAEAAIEKFRDIPAYVPPGPAFDAATKLRGKTIFEIPITSEVPFIAAVEEGMQQAADAVGAELVVYHNQGQPTQWAQGIRTAIARRVDAITLFAQDPALIRPQIAQAEEAGIPVIVVRTTGEGEGCQTDPDGKIYGTACVPGPFEQAGRLQADRAVLDTGGEANILVLTSKDARSTASLVRGLKDELRTRCPSCAARYVDVPIPDWATTLGTEVRSALVRDPSINYVIPIYDSMSQFVVPAILAAGAEERVKIATFNGTPFVLELIQDGDIVAMDAGENLAWVGWATMDQAFRVIAGEKPVQSEQTPLRVFDDANVGEAGRPPQLDEGYGSAYVAGYKQLWRVTD